MENYFLPSRELTTLDACLVIEETCAVIYHYFASLFRDNSNIAKMWAELAKEEEEHADKFRLAVINHGSDPKCLDNDNYLIEGMIENLDSLLARIKNNPPQLKDAFLTAAILEHSIEKYHVETGKLLVNKVLAEMLSEMAHNDRCHKEMLQSMYQ